MTYNPDIHHRRSIRLKNYDYSQAGAYFITICSKGWECFFGEVVRGGMRLNETGIIASRCWNALPEHFSDAVLDEFIVMPNHVHGIIIVQSANVGAQFIAPNAVEDEGVINHAPTIGEIVRSFKARCTRFLNRIRQYIIDNPLNWEMDENHAH